MFVKIEFQAVLFPNVIILFTPLKTGAVSVIVFVNSILIITAPDAETAPPNHDPSPRLGIHVCP
jgi:prepilin signal peptidase PulO-like enzyme (type II secretory pathway)